MHHYGPPIDAKRQWLTRRHGECLAPLHRGGPGPVPLLVIRSGAHKALGENDFTKSTCLVSFTTEWDCRQDFPSFQHIIKYFTALEQKQYEMLTYDDGCCTEPFFDNDQGTVYFKNPTMQPTYFCISMNKCTTIRCVLSYIDQSSLMLPNQTPNSQF